MPNSQLVYLNGELVPLAEAKVSVEDRGFNFADGIYEVLRIAGGRPFRVEDHLDRFASGARALEIDLPSPRDAIRQAIADVARANAVEEGTVYVQLTRGPATRSHAFPAVSRPTLVMLARPGTGPTSEQLERGVAAVTEPDLRWGYCEVKTIGLLPNVIAYQHARAEGCFEAILVRDGVVTEGAHSTAFCVQDGVVYTHPIDNLLPAITRKHVIRAFRAKGVEVQEIRVPLDDFRSADEVFLTGTTTEVLGVVSIDGEPVGGGKPGKLTRLAHQLYRRALDEARAAG